jgi:predicted 3-demethylubiquinone-9 3-methyltransferase (glyoxalase superfamily)
MMQTHSQIADTTANSPFKGFLNCPDQHHWFVVSIELRINAPKRYMQKITPFLWFDGKAEEAVNFYVSAFKDAKILDVLRYTEAGPGPEGSVMTIKFSLYGQEFVALNAGPEFTFTPAISFFVDCQSQEEVDELWEKLSAEGGETNSCGWLKDRYGVSWQIVPTILLELLGDKNSEKANRVMKAMLQMHKLNIAGLTRAYEQG